MSARIGINGFGRIGRDYLRYLLAAQDTDLEVVAINDVTDSATMARLLRYDSTFGPLRRDVEDLGDAIGVDGHRIAVSAERDPALVTWRDHGVEIVIESTGKFRTREAAAAHLGAGVSKVLLSSPGKGIDATIVMGVNDNTYDQSQHHIISNASCTTNCVAPMVKVLLRLDGVALRVPVVDGSLVDLAVLLERDVTAAEVNAAFEAAGATGPLAGRLRCTTDPVVSSDVIGDSASCVFDSELTWASGRFVKVFGWYDNEWGYTARLVDLTRLVAAQG